jgi:hypothetical protein
MIPLDQASEYRQVGNFTALLSFQSLQDFFDAFLFGLPDKSAGIDDQPIALLVAGDNFDMFFLQQAAEHFGIDNIFKASQIQKRCPGFLNGHGFWADFIKFLSTGQSAKINIFQFIYGEIIKIDHFRHNRRQKNVARRGIEPLLQG